MEPIFHIASSAAWAEPGDAYEGDTLDSEGFIHCSTARQVLDVADSHFRGRRDLLLLSIDPSRVGPEIRYENLEGGEELFPHVYGPLDRAAVFATEPLEAGADGRFASTPELRRAADAGGERRLRGSCLCGGIRFELRGDPLWLSYCHCGRCRKVGGMANLTVRAEHFHWVSGEDLVVRYRPEPPFDLIRCFCRVCGSYLGEPDTHPKVFPVAASTLDDDPGVRAVLHEHVADKAPWYEIHDELPQFQLAPPLAAFGGASNPERKESGTDEGPSKQSSLALLLKNLLFTFIVPGTVAVYVPLSIADGRAAGAGPLAIAAWPLLAVGCAIYAWCVWDFASFGRGTPAPIDAPRRLVVRGLYRYSRNPMYLGVLAVILGQAALFREPGVLLWGLAVGTCFHLFVLLYEEPHLAKVFGASYEEYRSRVGRWLPLTRRS